MEKSHEYNFAMTLEHVIIYFLTYLFTFLTIGINIEYSLIVNIKILIKIRYV